MTLQNSSTEQIAKGLITINIDSLLEHGDSPTAIILAMAVFSSVLLGFVAKLVVALRQSSAVAKTKEEARLEIQERVVMDYELSSERYTCATKAAKIGNSTERVTSRRNGYFSNRIL